MPATEDIIQDIWGGAQGLADDIGVARDTVRKWSKRIPSEHWGAVIAAATKRDRKLTADDLLAASAPMKRRGWPRHKKRSANASKGRASRASRRESYLPR
jgi:hypothetical protein